MNRIWLVAAENGALPGGKVGGVGDVVRDLPLALAATGLQLRVITPSYGMFHRLPGASLHRELQVNFAGEQLTAEVYRVPLGDSPVEHFVIEHELLSPCGPGQIYVSNDSGGPYEIDAAKFAFFNAALAAWVNVSDTPPDVLHLNDWHTGLVPALREFGDQQAALKDVRIIFTIHNLAYQGVRPLQGEESSLQSWFPDLLEHAEPLIDPKYDDCVNFMVSAIRLADEVNTVSPGYAMEIQRPGDPQTGFRGGEGLELDLSKIHSGGHLSGILNGCMYPDGPAPETDWQDLLMLIGQRPEIINADRSADEWLKYREIRQPQNLLLSIGRVVDQKAPLFLEPVDGYPSALEAILAAAGPETLFIMLGNGEKYLEERFVEIAHTQDNFLYLRGYFDALSGPLYAIADLFLMPSSFEPCGISQMLAMRAGQPCVVHAVGGLKDTVENNVTGFVFDGATTSEQAENFVRTVHEALTIKQTDDSRWQNICQQAANQRFSWLVAANTYKQELYQHA
ncbi:MAG: glycosyltransferase [Xanthomonadales bacterium]|nr:glycosyltransferase [Xanthomonadales bacterium]